jgi:hypothetical protein
MRRHDLQVQVRGARAEVERAERVIRSALTAAGFSDVEAEPKARHLRVVGDDDRAG